ncbi:MAG: hypothetical protein ACI4FX_05205 [Agathobacter sp.]
MKTEKKKKDEKRKSPDSRKKSYILTGCGVAVLTAGAILAAVFTNIKDAKAETIVFHDNEAMRVMDTPVTMGEYMLYSVDIRNQYETSMGDDFYENTGKNAKGETETCENIVKEEIAESIRMVKVLCKAAEPEFGITLSEDEKKTVEENADSYYENLVEGGVDPEFLTKGVTEKYIREQYLAQKVYAKLEEEYGTDTNGTVDVGNENDADTVVSTEISEELTDAVAELEEKYDGNYDFDTNINWELMDSYAFTEKTELTDESIQNAVEELTAGTENQ